MAPTRPNPALSSSSPGQSFSATAFGAATAAISRSSVQALMLATIPLATGLLICAVIMGPTAMTPADVVEAAEASTGIRAMIWLAVLAALCPAALALFRNRGLVYLRWLPIPAAVHLTTTGLFLIVLELPFAIFLLVAGRPLSALAAIAMGACFHLGIAMHGWLRIIPSGAAVATLLVFSVPPPIAIIALTIVAIVSLWLAWVRAPEARRRIVRLSVRGGPSRAIATALAARLIEPLLWTRVLAAAAAFGGVAGLLLLNNQLTTKASTITAIVSASSLGSIAACVSLATVLVRSRRELLWLLTANGATAAHQTLALTLVAFVVGSLFGLAVSAAALVVVRAPLLSASLAITGGAAASATLALIATATALSRPGHREANVWVAAVLMGLGIAAMLVVVGPLTLLFAVPFSLAAIHRIHETIELGREHKKQEVRADA